MPIEDAVRNLLYLKVRDIMGRYGRQKLNGFAAYQLDLAMLWQKHYGKSGAKDDLFLTFGVKNIYTGSGDTRKLTSYKTFIEHN